MSKKVADYITDCLRALDRLKDGEGALGDRIRGIHRYWEALWGGAVPPGERIFAAFISNDTETQEPTDLWYFSEHRCLVAQKFASEQMDVLIFPFKAGLRRIRITKNYDQKSQVGSKIAVGLWFDDESEGVIEASDANCVPLETLLTEVLIPKLQS
jgi:hypothetical protein